jgi:hypothetical protein
VEENPGRGFKIGKNLSVRLKIQSVLCDFVVVINYTGVRHMTTFQSTTDHMYDGGPIRL